MRDAVLGRGGRRRRGRDGGRRGRLPPEGVADRKLKKDHGVPELVLEPTPDILAELGAARRPGQVLVGFAAETDDVEAAGRDEAPTQSTSTCSSPTAWDAPGPGSGRETNDAALLAADGDDVPLRRWTKPELADGALRSDRRASSGRPAPDVASEAAARLGRS